MKNKMLGIGAIAILAAVLIASSNVGSSDVFAAKKYGQSNAQSAAVSNECTPVTDAGNGDNPIDVFANTIANCIGTNVQNQDSDGASIISNPSASSDNDQS